MSDPSDLAATLRADAVGGRVSHTRFLDPDEADALLAAVRATGVAADAWGGDAGARRRVVTARPDHVPSAAPALVAWYAAGVETAGALRDALIAAGVEAAALGDEVAHRDGRSIIALAGTAMPEVVALAGRSATLETVPLERVARGTRRRVTAVVPALRVDVLGARAFGVSRSWFTKGVAAGHVHVNGRRADKRSDATAGDEVFADGLGRFRVLEVLGSTRRGNVRVELEVERGAA